MEAARPASMSISLSDQATTGVVCSTGTGKSKDPPEVPASQGQLGNHGGHTHHVVVLRPAQTELEPPGRRAKSWGQVVVASPLRTPGVAVRQPPRSKFPGNLLPFTRGPWSVKWCRPAWLSKACQPNVNVLLLDEPYRNDSTSICIL
jgi:hypothetical protein